MIREAIDQFADSYMEAVLHLMEGIERGVSPDAPDVHAALVRRLKNGRVAMRQHDDWNGVAYALAAWTDELLVDAEWKGRMWWRDHVLETHLFGSRLCSERFFLLAKVAAKSPESGVLRVFHDCVALGFQGVYALPEHAEVFAAQVGIAPTREQWIADAQTRLVDATTTLSPARQRRLLDGAPPLDRRLHLVWWTVAACVLIAVNITAWTLTQRS